eukprot:144407_1
MAWIGNIAKRVAKVVGLDSDNDSGARDAARRADAQRAAAERAAAERAAAAKRAAKRAAADREAERKHELQLKKMEAERAKQEAQAKAQQREAEIKAQAAQAKADQEAKELAIKHEEEMAKLAQADAAERAAAQLKMQEEKARLEKEAKELQQNIEKEKLELKAKLELEAKQREEAAIEAQRKYDEKVAEQKRKDEELKAEREKARAESEHAQKLELAQKEEEMRQAEAERRQKEAKDKADREAAVRSAKLKEQEKNKAYLEAEIKSANEEIKTCEDLQAQTIKEIKITAGKEEQLKGDYLRHRAKYEQDLAVIVKKIELAAEKYADAHGKIRDAINGTNVDEGSIPQFLNLINDGLIGSTLGDTVSREQLNAKIGAFADLIESRTSTSLPIDFMFRNKLAPFVTYLEAEKYTAMDDILCDDKKEFDDVLQVIEKGIERENKEIEQENEDIDEVTDKIKTKNAKINEKIAAIDKKIDEIKEEIGRLKEEKAKEKDWEKAKEKIADIDQKIETLQKQIDAPDEAKEKDGTQEDKEKAIAAVRKQIDELKAQKAQEEQDGAKGKEIAEKLCVQEELLTQKNEQKEEQLAARAKLPTRRDPIEPIRTKQKKGGPVFMKLKKLCMRDLAEGKRGWLKKLGGDDADTDIPLKTYFKGKLVPFIKYLEDEDYETMDDILCDEEDDFETILKIIDAGIEKDNGKPLKKGTSGKESGAYKELKKMCLREFAAADGGWMKQQKIKKKQVTAQLNEYSPLLATFFGEIDVAVNEARKYLVCGKDKTPEQLLAIKNASVNEKKLKAIKASEEDESEEDEDKEENKEDAGVSEEEARELKLMKQENTAYLSAAVVRLHVVDALAHKFEEGEQPETRKTGLTLARDVETCSLQIMESQATIRSSVLIARQLVEFKPAKPGKQAAPFWKVIDAGIVNIFNNYIEMMKIASIYFSYFVKFKAAFEYYVSCREIQKEDSDLMVATEYLQRDVKSFTAFKSKMQATVDKLTNDAKTIISDCVSKTSGAQSFKKAQEEREKATAELLRQQKDLNDKRFKLVTAFNAPHDAWKERAAELDRLKFVKQQRDEKIQFLTRHAENANEKLLEFSNAKQDDAKEEDDPEKDIKGAVVDDANSAAKGDAKQDDAEEEDDAKKDIKGAVVDDANSAAKGDEKQD